MKSSNTGIIALTTTALIWGATLPLMKANLDTIPPFSLAFGRFFIAAILAVLFLNFKSLKLKDFFHIAVFSFFGITLHIGLFLNGLANSTSIDATFILALSPIITSLTAVIAIKENITFWHKIGILLAFLGTFVYIIYPHIFSGQSFGVNFVGDLLVLLSVLSGAVYVVGSKKLFELYPPASVSTVSFITGAVSFLPFAFLEFFNKPEWVDEISTFNIVSVLFLGIFSSFAAYSLLEWGLSRVDVHINEVISYLTAIISIYLSKVFLNENLNPAFLLSIVLIALGIYLVTRFKPKNHPHFHHRVHRV